MALRTSLATVALLALTSTAHAHIRVVNMMSRDGDAQKDAPCGAPGSQWGANGVVTETSGSTITVTINEYIRHPGYFRIAFDADGDGDFRDPISIQPIDPNRVNQGARDQDKGSDFCSNPTVLMDNLDAHMTGGGMRSYDVKLPDIACERCTLQIIQVMEDVIHGPYNTELDTSGFDLPDLYHQCIDMKLVPAAGSTPTGKTPECTTGALVGGQMNALAQDAGVVEETASKSDDGCALNARRDASWLLLSLALLLRRKTKPA